MINNNLYSQDPIDGWVFLNEKQPYETTIGETEEMEWFEFKKKYPEEGKLVAVWRKKHKRFFIGSYEKGPIRAQNLIQKASSEPHHWKSNTSGNNLSLAPEDWWIELPELVVTEIFR